MVTILPRRNCVQLGRCAGPVTTGPSSTSRTSPTSMSERSAPGPARAGWGPHKPSRSGRSSRCSLKRLRMPAPPRPGASGGEGRARAARRRARGCYSGAARLDGDQVGGGAADIHKNEIGWPEFGRRHRPGTARATGRPAPRERAAGLELGRGGGPAARSGGSPGSTTPGQSAFRSKAGQPPLVRCGGRSGSSGQPASPTTGSDPDPALTRATARADASLVRCAEVYPGERARLKCGPFTV